MPPDLAVMNAANLCPASRPALEALARETQNVDRDPSPNNRARLYPEKENTRKALAEFLRVTPDEIIITRNTSESNNLVSSGLDLKAGDEVIVHGDNHPSNLNAWREKGKRFGFTVVTVEQKNPHPGNGVLHRRLHARDHAAHEGAVLHAPVEHGGRPDAGTGAVPDRARARRPDARRRRAELRAARRQPRGHPAGLLLRQRAQVAVRRPRVRRALRQQRGAVEALAEHLQRLRRRRRVLAHVRGFRAARRGDDDRVPGGAGVPAEGRASGYRDSGARAQHPAHRGADGAARRHGVDVAQARIARGRRLVPAGNARRQASWRRRSTKRTR